MKSQKQPNPGSQEAIDRGCSCPVMDNSYGRGYLGSDTFVYNMECSLHKGYEEEHHHSPSTD